jgi:hypothetical protein
MDSQANFLLGSIKELVVVEELRDIAWPLTPF